MAVAADAAGLVISGHIINGETPQMFELPSTGLEVQFDTSGAQASNLIPMAMLLDYKDAATPEEIAVGLPALERAPKSSETETPVAWAGSFDLLFNALEHRSEVVAMGTKAGHNMVKIINGDRSDDMPLWCKC